MKFEYIDKEPEIGDLVIWGEGYLGSLVIPDKPYFVTDKTNTGQVKVLTEDGNLTLMGRLNRRTLKQIPTNEAKVGDYMFRLTKGQKEFPKGAVAEIIKNSNKIYHYEKARSVIDFEVIFIRPQKEKTMECKYPLFMQWKDEKTFIVKFEDLGSGFVMTKSEGWEIGAFYDMFIHHTNNQWEPCDFTKEPEIFDLDWYEARYQAGLPVYVVSKNTYQLCKHVPPKGWSSYETFAIEIPNNTSNLDNPKTLKDWDKRFEAGLPVWHQLNYKTYCMCQKSPCNYTEGTEFYTANPSCQDNVEANQQTKKENPMKLQELINQIFKSDYENKPNFLVTVYEKEGSEFASTTANSLEEIEKAVAADYRLVGYKIVAYKIHTEFESAIPVTKTKLKIEKETL